MYKAVFSEAVANQVLADLSTGMSKQRAAGRLGLSPQALSNWLKKGRDIAKLQQDREDSIQLSTRDELLLNFFLRHESVFADLEAEHLNNISAAGHETKTWQASAWFLQHCIDPVRYGNLKGEELARHIIAQLGKEGLRDLFRELLREPDTEAVTPKSN